MLFISQLTICILNRVLDKGKNKHGEGANTAQSYQSFHIDNLELTVFLKWPEDKAISVFRHYVHGNDEIKNCWEWEYAESFGVCYGVLIPGLIFEENWEDDVEDEDIKGEKYGYFEVDLLVFRDISLSKWVNQIVDDFVVGINLVHYDG